MDFILFMFFSVLEVLAIFYFMFRLFKLDMYYISIIFTGLIMSYISYTLREVFHLTPVDIVFQFFLALGFVWLLFKVSLFYAGVMVGIAYIAFNAIQTSIYFLARLIGLITIVPDPNNIFIYVLQTISCLIFFFIGWHLYRKNIGFDFVPHSQHEKVTMNGRNRIIILLYIPAVLSIFFIHYLFFTTNNWIILLIPILLGVVLFCLLYWSYKRDRSND